MAVWPTTLPNPSNSDMTMDFGSNTMLRRCQSGRIDVVRFGYGNPDKWAMKIRLFGNQFDEFRSFFNGDLNMGTNWFSATWIAEGLGYPDHKGRIIGYPQEVGYGKNGSGTSYRDIFFRLLIKPSSSCPDDTVWGQYV